MPDYDEHYDLQESLAKNPRIIGCPELYPYSTEKLYASGMDRLARPLSTGKTSPFSSQAPGSVGSILMAGMVQMLATLAHEVNMRPTADWIENLRMFGIELSPADFPIISLTFTRNEEALRAGIHAEVPRGTTIRSSRNRELSATVQQTITLSGDERTKAVPARLDRLGEAPGLLVGEFTDMPAISSIESVLNDGRIISEGRNVESLIEGVLRAREGIRTGNLGRFTENALFNPEADTYLGRCVTPRDFVYYALCLGAQQATMLSNLQYGSQGIFRDLATVVVYPPETVVLAEEPLTAMSGAQSRVHVIGAEVIPIDGIITVRVLPNLTDSQVRQLAATAITPTIPDPTRPSVNENSPVGLNPPAGKWGDRAFAKNVAIALEKTLGIYAVPELRLKHSETNVPLEELDIQPWNLLEIQSSIEFEVKR